MKLFYTAGLAVIFFMLGGCGNGDGDSSTESVYTGKLEIGNAWVRPGAEGGNSAAYMRISNGTETDDTLTGISSDVSGRASLHETMEKDGLTEMHAAGDTGIESGSCMELEPGGKHIMLMELNRDLAEGDSVRLTLEFTHYGSLEATVPVRVRE